MLRRYSFLHSKIEKAPNSFHSEFLLPKGIAARQKRELSREQKRE
jgi:hypothetical protein